jgi:hypothetical protein
MNFLFGNVRSAVIAAAFCVGAANANAAVINYSFTATHSTSTSFTQGDQTNLPNPGVTAGLVIHGNFSYDPATTTYPGSNGVFGYGATLVVPLPNFTLDSSVLPYATVVSAYNNQPLYPAPFDAFYISAPSVDLPSPSQHYVAQFFALSLYDSTAQVFSSITMPSSLDLTKFDRPTITVDYLDYFTPTGAAQDIQGLPLGRSHFEFKINELSLIAAAPVPGPVVGAGLPALVIAAAGLMFFSRRRRNQAAVA